MYINKKSPRRALINQLGFDWSFLVKKGRLKTLHDNIILDA